MRTRKTWLLATLFIFMFTVVGILIIKRNRDIKAEERLIAGLRSAKKPQVDNRLESLINIFNQLNIVDSEILSSKMDVCYLGNVERGWTVASKYQTCYLRYTATFSTDLTKQEVAQLLSSSGASKYLGKFIGQDGGYTQQCSLFSNIDEGNTMVYRPANMGEFSQDSPCSIPDQDNLYPPRWSSTFASSAHDSSRSSYAYSSYDQNSVDNSKNRIWIAFREGYYKKDISCGINVFFCSVSTHDKVVHPPL